MDCDITQGGTDQSQVTGNCCVLAYALEASLREQGQSSVRLTK